MIASETKGGSHHASSTGTAPASNSPMVTGSARGGTQRCVLLASSTLATLAWMGLEIGACSSGGNSNPADSGVSDSTLPDTSGEIANSEPDAGPEAEAQEGSPDAEAPDACATADNPPPCQPYDASMYDAATIAAGMVIVTQNSCFKCHQDQSIEAGLILNGSDRSAGFGILAYPPNLTPDPATGLGCWTDQQIANAILNGVDNQGVTLCVMPLFGKRFAEAGLDPNGEASQIIAFLRSLRPACHQVPDSMCPVLGDAGPNSDSGADSSADSGADASADSSADAYTSQ